MHKQRLFGIGLAAALAIAGTATLADAQSNEDGFYLGNSAALLDVGIATEVLAANATILEGITGEPEFGIYATATLVGTTDGAGFGQFIGSDHSVEFGITISATYEGLNLLDGAVLDEGKAYSLAIWDVTENGDNALPIIGDQLYGGSRVVSSDFGTAMQPATPATDALMVEAYVTANLSDTATYPRAADQDELTDVAMLKVIG